MGHLVPFLSPCTPSGVFKHHTWNFDDSPLFMTEAEGFLVSKYTFPGLFIRESDLFGRGERLGNLYFHKILPGDSNNHSGLGSADTLNKVIS